MFEKSNIFNLAISNNFINFRYIYILIIYKLDKVDGAKKQIITKYSS